MPKVSIIPTVLEIDRFGPISGGDGSDLAGDGAEAVPGDAAGLDDRAVALQDAACPPPRCSGSGGRFGLQPHRVATFKLSTDPRLRRQGRATSSGSTSPRRTRRSSCASTRSRMCGWPPARKGDVERLLQRVACGHVSGLMRGRQGPQAPMGSADRDLNRSSGLRPSTSPGFPRSVGATDHPITLLPLQASARRPRLTLRPRFGRWSAAPSAPRRSAPSCWPTRPPPRAGGVWRAAPGSRDWPWSPWSTTAPTARR